MQVVMTLMRTKGASPVKYDKNCRRSLANIQLAVLKILVTSNSNAPVKYA